MSPTNLCLAATVAAVAALPGAPAWSANADPVFDAFAAACARPAADFAGVKAVADAQPWGPTDVKPDAAMSGVTVSDSLSRGATVDKRGLVLSAWRGTTGNGLRIGDCTVRVQRADFAVMKGAAGAWLAFPAQEDGPKRTIYRFEVTNGVRRPVAQSEFDSAAAGAGLQILTVSGDANGTLIDLMVIRK